MNRKITDRTNFKFQYLNSEILTSYKSKMKVSSDPMLYSILMLFFVLLNLSNANAISLSCKSILIASLEFDVLDVNENSNLKIRSAVEYYRAKIDEVEATQSKYKMWHCPNGGCIELSQQLYEVLFGIQELKIERVFGNGHWYLVDKTFGAGNEIIIDPTYKQFFEDYKESYGKNEPGIFIGTKNDWIAMAIRFDQNGSPALDNGSAKESPDDYFNSIYIR